VENADLLHICHDDFIVVLKQDSVGPDALLKIHLEAHNDCRSERPRDITMAVLSLPLMSDQRFIN
jgi:hypothetical protein